MVLTIFIPLFMLGCAIVLGFSLVNLGPFVATATVVFGVTPVFIRHPRYAVYFFAFASFFDSINIDLPVFILGLGDVSALLLVGIWAVRRLYSNQHWQWPRATHWLILFMLLGIVSLLHGIEPDKMLGGYIRLVVRVIAMIAFVDLVRREKTLINCLYCFAASGLIHAFLGFILADPGDGRLKGLIDQPNQLGACLSIGLIPLTALLQRPNTAAVRLGLVLGVAFLTTALILTGSRGAYLAILTGLIWWSRRSGKRVILFSAVGLIAFFSASQYSEQQITTIEERLHFRDSSTEKRKNVLITAGEVIRKYPWLGIGFGQFGSAYKAMTIEGDRGRSTHSFFVGVAASMGLPALFCLLSFLGSQIRKVSLRMRENVRLENKVEDSRWLNEVITTLMVFHFFSLLTRGTDFYDWTVFTLYAALAALPTKEPAKNANAQRDVPSTGVPSVS